jgi:hypothetical protein
MQTIASRRRDVLLIRTSPDYIISIAGKRSAFHEPPVQNPEATAMCHELRQARGRVSDAGLLDICLSRSSEAACMACLGAK